MSRSILKSKLLFSKTRTLKNYRFDLTAVFFLHLELELLYEPPLFKCSLLRVEKLKIGFSDKDLAPVKFILCHHAS